MEEQLVRKQDELEEREQELVEVLNTLKDLKDSNFVSNDDSSHAPFTPGHRSQVSKMSHKYTTDRVKPIVSVTTTGRFDAL